MFDLTRPCVNCPFRKGQGELFGMHRLRLKEIINAVAFQCHRTVVYGAEQTDEGESITSSGDRPQQCAGLMAVLHRSDKPNQIMQVAERLGHLDPTKLDPKNEAYASIADAMRAHITGEHDGLFARAAGRRCCVERRLATDESRGHPVSVLRSV